MQYNHFICSSSSEQINLKDLNIFLHRHNYYFIKKRLNKKFNYKISESFFYDEDFKSKTNNYLSNIEENFFQRVKKILSEVHNSDFSNRSWKLIIGHWLRKYIYILYNIYFIKKRL